MTISLRSPRVLCGPLALIAALLCALAFTPGSALASSLTGPTGTVDIGSAEIGSSTTAHIPLTGSACGTLSVSSSNPDFALDHENFSFVAGSCDFQLTMLFTPAVVGTETGTLTVTDGSGGSVQIQVTGDGASPAFMSLNEVSNDFGSVPVGQNSTATTFTVTNSGGSNLNIGQASLLGADPDQFAVTSDTCSDSAVGPNATCTIGVRFSPTSRGAQVATLELPSNDPDSPVDIALTGSGLAPAALLLDQTSDDFGSWTLGQSSGSDTYAVTNTGDENLNIGQVTLGGANPGQFAITSDTCSNETVAGEGGFCTVAVQYNALARGAQSAELDIPSNDPNTPAVIALSGTGLLPAAVSPDRTSNDFGAVTVGQYSATTFTVTNTGEQRLGIKHVLLGGANADQFAIDSNTCITAGPAVQPAIPGGIRAGGTCTITVQFNPTATGAQTAELDITPAGSATPTVITLSGTGAAASQPAPPAPPTKPVQPTQPTPQPKPVAQVSNLGQPAGAQQLLSSGEKERVYCNQACSLTVTLEVYYRAITRGKHYRGLLNAQTARVQPWMRVNVGHATVKMTAAGYKVVSVKVAAHKQAVKDAGSILLGVYTHNGRTLVRKRWMQVKGPNMNALVQALNQS
ncbi:MAG TPA: choice-of-anchor D domain-containing protein [Solirubrobacteraceae bacterium]|jgi:hypothetical protein